MQLKTVCSFLRSRFIPFKADHYWQKIYLPPVNMNLCTDSCTTLDLLIPWLNMVISGVLKMGLKCCINGLCQMLCSRDSESEHLTGDNQRIFIHQIRHSLTRPGEYIMQKYFCMFFIALQIQLFLTNKMTSHVTISSNAFHFLFSKSIIILYML